MVNNSILKFLMSPSITYQFLRYWHCFACKFELKISKNMIFEELASFIDFKFLNVYVWNKESCVFKI